jgi:hypothetical protein
LTFSPINFNFIAWFDTPHIAISFSFRVAIVVDLSNLRSLFENLLLTNSVTIGFWFIEIIKNGMLKELNPQLVILDPISHFQHLILLLMYPHYHIIKLQSNARIHECASKVLDGMPLPDLFLLKFVKVDKI